METKDTNNKELDQAALKTLKSAENGQADEDIEDVPRSARSGSSSRYLWF